MIKKIWKSMSRYINRNMLMMNLLMVLFLTACGQTEPDSNAEGSPAPESNVQEGSTSRSENVSDKEEASAICSEAAAGQRGSSAGQSVWSEDTTGQKETAVQPENAADQSAQSQENTEEAAREEIKRLFGDSCIPEQTFEVSLSEYDGKVWFVPYAPTEDKPYFRIEIIQDGRTLAEDNGYVPEALRGMQFVSLDAVSFFDVNFDGNTDIVMIETYGKVTFASVLYGYKGSNDHDPYFDSQYTLNEKLTDHVKPLTISGIKSFLPDGPKDGVFSDYRDAYRVIGSMYDMEHGNNDELKFDLVYIDDDEIPELAAGLDGYYLSLYTFRDGRVYRLMDDWGYGIHGNPGYEYVPRRNSLRFYSTEYAGAILYTSYLNVNNQNELDMVTVMTYNFDDANDNGVFDDNEMESLGNYSVSYIDEREISVEELTSFEQGEYMYIRGRLSLAELLEKCSEKER